MSIISNLYQGVSGLNSNATQMEVVGNNIANVNTVGFKAGRVNFAELLGRTVLGASGPGQIGGGSAVDGIQQLFHQGSFAGTGQATDLAVAGEGFFVVNGQSGGTQGSFYTRAGAFRMDAEGFLTTGGGLRLQGYQPGGDGEIGAKLGDINISTDPISPQATESIEMLVGLASETELPDPVPAFDPANPEGDFSTTVTVFDSLGNAHKVDVFLSKTAENTWSWNAVAPSGEIDGADTSVDFASVGSGTLTFNSDGQLQTETGGPLDVTFNGASAQSIALDFGQSIDDGGDGTGVSEQFQEAGDNTLLGVEQDGRSSGVLQGIRVDSEGTIVGAYSNGEELDLGRVALARFNANTGLDNIGGNLFRATGRSGEPVIGEPDSGGRGSVMGATLEQSNVDIAAEFVNLITAQRGYQANARTITTADEIYQETVNIKR